MHSSHCTSIKHARGERMQEDPPPASTYKIERSPYDMDSDEDEGSAPPEVPAFTALLQQLKLLTVFQT